jgi:hypothetical protein
MKEIERLLRLERIRIWRKIELPGGTWETPLKKSRRGRWPDGIGGDGQDEKASKGRALPLCRLFQGYPHAGPRGKHDQHFEAEFFPFALFRSETLAD